MLYSICSNDAKLCYSLLEFAVMIEKWWLINSKICFSHVLSTWLQQVRVVSGLVFVLVVPTTWMDNFNGKKNKAFLIWDQFHFVFMLDEIMSKIIHYVVRLSKYLIMLFSIWTALNLFSLFSSFKLVINYRSTSCIIMMQLLLLNEQYTKSVELYHWIICVIYH